MKLLEKARLRKSPGGDGAPLAEDLAEMSFLDHLEELRWSLIRGFCGVLTVTIVSAFFSQWIIDVLLLGPTRPEFFVYRWMGLDATELVLQNRTITGQFFAHWGTVLVVGVILGSPIFIFYLWKFIEPGLYPTERQGLRFSAAFATFFFALGIGFGYCVITPIALQFFASYSISDQIINEFDITRYFSMVTFWAFGCGVLFQMPVAVYFLARVGLVTPGAMRKYRKYALIVTLVLGALFTPPDPVSQILVAVPLLGLYELSIGIATVISRRYQRDLARMLD